ncbi:uncharacterized protein [Parasteatoda tepidariorum]|uniref:uncharacterized protein n=1 Tax=Parasteatoda tepidariorum TaxID=114398 RepID=UPI00077FAB40|nr:uncharacterized protein LOC107456506 [Parasteatoda tepidariorum]
MFHHHTENSPSTGEPPTPPLTAEGGDRLAPPPSDHTSVGQWPNNSRLFFEPTSSTMVEQTERGRSNTIPSHDSGYEMSPNLNPSDSREFFTELEVFEDVRDPDDEQCSECGNDFCQCQRSHSSRTTVRSFDGTPSNVYCDMYSFSSSSYQRPSSLPIEIPVAPRRTSTMLPSSSFSLHPRQIHSSRSLPLTHSHNLPVFDEFLYRSQPRVWPIVMSSNTNHLSSNHRRNQSLSNLRPSFDLGSSLSSSMESFFDLEPLDGVGDDVFQNDFYEMAEADVSFHPSADYRRRLNSEAASQPLPDLLLHASPRRSRSASVNLPPDHAVLRDIGRSLRRISDDFQTRLSGQQQSNNDRSSFNNNRPVFKFFKKF